MAGRLSLGADPERRREIWNLLGWTVVVAMACYAGVASVRYWRRPPVRLQPAGAAFEVWHYGMRGVGETAYGTSPFGPATGRQWSMFADGYIGSFRVHWMRPTRPGALSSDVDALLKQLAESMTGGAFEKSHSTTSLSGRPGVEAEVRLPAGHYWRRAYLDGPEVYLLEAWAELATPVAREHAERFLDSFQFLGPPLPRPTPPLPSPAPTPFEADPTGAPVASGTLLRPRFRTHDGRVLQGGLGFVVEVEGRPVLLTAGWGLLEEGGWTNEPLDLDGVIAGVDLLDWRTGEELGTAGPTLLCHLCLPKRGMPPDAAMFRPPDTIAFAVKPGARVTPWRVSQHALTLRERVWVVGPPRAGGAEPMVVRPGSVSVGMTSIPGWPTYDVTISTSVSHEHWRGAPVLDDSGAVLGSYRPPGKHVPVVVFVDVAAVMVRQLAGPVRDHAAGQP